MTNLHAIGILLLSLTLCSCGPDSNPQPPYSEAKVWAEISNKQLKTQWLLSYSTLANKGTERTYQCISEMYSLAYSPVNSGPVCSDSCELWKKLNEMVDQAPPYIENASQYKVEKGKVCTSIEKRKARKK